ncbi:hypothetical protein [uncultured Ilyobacter sp.]|uniref:hypothetical protein n=1 Tax=uncultured Ilyobacter sp. TaxID=544433 RepID=UPI0029C8B16F|nr:hypothetical protein [uncultured Ilyobacter sp.]
MKFEITDIILKKDHFPCLLKKTEGQTLKKFFDIDEVFIKNRCNRNHVDDLEFRYIYKDEQNIFVLIEEYLFKENEAILTIENSIGVNYYLNKTTKN